MAAFGEQTLGWFAAGEGIDTPSVAALVRDHSSLVFRVAYGVLRNRAEAEDTVQDVFLRVLQKESTLGSIVEIRAWLVRITWNLAVDRRRRIRPGQLDPEFAALLVSPGLSPEHQLRETRRMQQVLTGIDALPRLEREVLLLSAIEELNTREIATILGKSESSIRSLLFRARTRLKERLGEEVR